MTVPEVGELWEYKANSQLLRVLVLEVKQSRDNGDDGVRIRTMNILCQGFGQGYNEWWFSTANPTRKLWTRLA